MCVRSSPVLLKWLSLVLLVTASGCRSASGSHEGAMQVDTLPSGALRLTHHLPDDRFDPGRALTLVEEVRVGAVEGDGPEVFGSVRGVAADEEGALWVLDAQAAAVRVFNADGTFRTSFGRQGDGPGEFREPNGMLRTPGGELLVSDPRNQRITRFGPDGGLRQVHRVVFPSYGFIWAAVLDPRDRVLDRQIRGPFVRGEPVRLMLSRLDLGAEQVDTLPYPWFDEGAAARRTAWEFERGSMGIPFAASLVSVVDPSLDETTVWAGWSDGYTVVRVSLDGDTLLEVRGNAQPVPVSAEERADAIRRAEAFVTQVGGAPPDYADIPGVKPLLARLDLDSRGRLWVQMEAPDGSSRFDIFSRDGLWEASVVSPVPMDRFSPRVIDGARFIAVITDELGIAYVTRFRLEEG